jgi:RNA polymerase sigma factor for flagellar operon FliA
VADVERTRATIATFVEALHLRASRRCRSLRCCGPNDAITAVGGSCASVFSVVDVRDEVTTLRQGWRDDSTIRARFSGGLKLVDEVARGIPVRAGLAARATADDLQAFGREGLLDAARSYNEERGVPFEAWARLRIRGAIVQGLRQWGMSKRRLRDVLVSRPEEAEEVTAEGHAQSEIGGPVRRRTNGAWERGAGAVSPERLAAIAEVQALLRRIVDNLPDRQRELVRRCHFEGQSQEAAARALGIGPSAAGEEHARALVRIRKKLARQGVDVRSVTWLLAVTLSAQIA